MKIKYYRFAIFVVTALLLALNLFFIVRTVMIMTSVENVLDYVLLLVSLFLLTTMMVMHIVNTAISIKYGSAFIRPLIIDEQGFIITKFMGFTYVFMVISAGVVTYFMLVLFGVPLYFSSMLRPVSYLILNLFALTLTDCIFIVTYPLVANQDIRRRRRG